ncbi:S24 family peptidase [Rhizobium sp. Leaf386]|uniref:S24 family peptidase n=1 Tax=Rhizobium sp. Leaf386 TaxID=1736359 RepID=UPI000714F8E2|nr:S24 family peptidase [Rhizobium sp. Leaf386]KQS95352.1 repressor [Rhizobium sp. Leaf386]
MTDPQEPLKLWLAEKLASGRVGTKLAAFIGGDMTPTKVSRMKNLFGGEKEARSIAPHHIEAIAKFFQELPPGYEEMTSWLAAAPTPVKRPTPNASFPPRYQKFPGDVAIPLRGQIAAGPNGRFIMNGQDIAHVFCPPGLEDVEGAYAVQIQGTSGEPRFYHGETAWINPHLRVRERDDVIVQVLDDDGEVASYIKRYVSRSDDVLRLYQYNPGEGESHDLEFDSKKVFSVHKVVFHALI